MTTTKKEAGISNSLQKSQEGFKQKIIFEA